MMHIGRSKRYHFVPPSHHPSHSLKSSQNHFYSHLTKRHSLDSKNQKYSFLDNIEDIPKHSVSKNKIGKSKESQVKSKYYWRGKSYRSGKKEERHKSSKVKGTWS